ncbi:MAG: HAMP domain-containing histidine kinase [Lachnospiraceae bacterium]|nr:HAMP domain-containing histidine kinase [Lachnospiraceae bacterium]
MLATSSKNKNKLRWFIGIIVGLIVTVGGYFAMQWIMVAKSVVDPSWWYNGGRSNTTREYIKYIDGMAVRYRTLSGQPNRIESNLDGQVAMFLAKYGEELLIAVLALCMFLLVKFLRSKKIWKDTECAHRKGIAYMAEAVAFAVCCLPVVFHEFEYYFEHYRAWEWWDSFQWVEWMEYTVKVSAPVLESLVYFFVIFWYLRPLFVLGWKEYIKEYSLLYLIYRTGKKAWRRFKTALDDVDFSKNPDKLLWKAVLIQFGILLLCVCCWFIGIPLLIAYSVALFFFLKRYYQKAEKGYLAVRQEVEEIAKGDLNGQPVEDFGMFRPLGDGLSQIKAGFRTAVEEEVKSERMKTELITNVSHDLKTPLTAILTYVELLKREDITEEERASYIETLEKKSNRLKVLIEDLFEVSRAASNNIVLQKTEVDLVKMVKQAAVEHEERFAEGNLNLRQTMPEEICRVYVDGQKTYRIFENLFSNICKYAMPGSRVYVRVYEKLGWYYAELKNMSAMELSVEAEELTERFVRGDASRNTEGSGLGLAIAKNLTEVQGGSFRVETDGDLFKVELGFPKLMYEEM